MFTPKFRLRKLVISIGMTLFIPMFVYAKAPPTLDDETVEDTPTTTQGRHVPLEDVQRFSNALNLIKKYYVSPVGDKQLFDNAIKGLLAGLDPHSSYLDEKAYKDLQDQTSGEFGGIGIEVTQENGVIKVVTPIDDSPAYKAGLKDGDYIIKLGNKSVEGIDLLEAVNLMRGKPGTTVDLTILRKGVNHPLKYSLVREIISVKSVKSRLIDNQYGYVRISQFQTQTTQDLEKAILALKQQAGGKLKGLILDLRDNPGGLLDSAIGVSDAFLDLDATGKQELIVYTQGKLPASKFTAIANPGDILEKAPLVVLINNGSASASEIVAGALKDNKRAIIVGTRSFGKGSVQTVLPLDDKRAIKLTTALYYTPSGVSIQAHGISPDITIEEINLSKALKAENGLDLSEADLQGHIANKQDKATSKAPNPTPTVKKAANAKDVPATSTQGTQDFSLFQKDYQLYAAITILKGLAVANK